MKHSGIPKALMCPDEVGPDDICTELSDMDSTDFERCWVPLILDLITRDDVSIRELAKLLRMVRDRYRVEKGVVEIIKVCAACNQMKRARYYFTDTSKKDGLRAVCKRCVRKQAAARSVA